MIEQVVLEDAVFMFLNGSSVLPSRMLKLHVPTPGGTKKIN